MSHKIDWVYKENIYLLRCIEFGHWRKVTDFEGFTGWMYKDLLSGTRYMLQKEILLRNKAELFFRKGNFKKKGNRKADKL